MNLFFKQKKAKSDFEESGLPSNRIEVFFDALKLRFFTFIKLGLVLLLFALPLVIADIVKDNCLYSVQIAYSQAEITEDYYSGLVTTIEIIYYISEMICFIVLGLGLSGTLRVIRQIIWGEPVFFSQDFADGIKKQGARYAIYFFFLGLFNFFGRLIIVIGFEAEFVRYIPLGMNFVVFLPPLCFALAQSLIYNFKIFDEYKNGFILYLKTLPKTIIATAIICLPLLLDLIGLIVLKYILIIVFIVAVLPILLMGELLFFVSVFDEHINKERYPEIYDKGIKRKSVQ